MAIALREPDKRALAMPRPCPAAHLQLDQPFGGETGLAQDIRVGSLLQEGATVLHLLGHRGFLGRVESRNPTPRRRIANNRRTPDPAERAQSGTRSLFKAPFIDKPNPADDVRRR